MEAIGGAMHIVICVRSANQLFCVLSTEMCVVCFVLVCCEYVFNFDCAIVELRIRCSRCVIYGSRLSCCGNWEYIIMGLVLRLVIFLICGAQLVHKLKCVFELQ